MTSDTPAACLTRGGIARGIKRLAPIAVFVLPFGMAYGIAAVERGMTVAHAMASSMIIISGAAQFAVLDIWSAEVSVLTMVLLVIAIGARHVLLGAALAPWVNQLDGKRQILTATMLTDPNFADTHSALKAGERDIGILVGGGLILWVAWVAGTAIGVFGGNLIGDPAAYGIDALMPDYFAALAVPMLRGSRKWLFAVVAAVVAVTVMPFVPAGWQIIVAALAGGLVGMVHGDG